MRLTTLTFPVVLLIATLFSSFHAMASIMSRDSPFVEMNAADIPKEVEMQKFVVLKSDFDFKEESPDENVSKEMMKYFFEMMEKEGVKDESGREVVNDAAALSR